MTQLGRYQITGSLGQGGMGTVYRATDPRLNRSVAIKTITGSDLSPDESQRFLREILAGGSLSHKNIVTFYDADRDGATIFIVMELIDGHDLRKVLRSGPLEAPRLIDILSNVAEALDHIHVTGIVHRDIKPANIMVGADGRIKVADFGIAKLLDRHSITPKGGVLGTPAYIAPELWDGETETGHCDQFSLAVIAYEGLVGRTPFVSEGFWTGIAKSIQNDPVPATSLGQEVDAVLEKALAKKPSARYPDCRTFISALRDALDAPRKEAERLAREMAEREARHAHERIATLESSLSSALRQAQAEQAARKTAKDRLEGQLREVTQIFEAERTARQAAEQEAAARKAAQDDQAREGEERLARLESQLSEAWRSVDEKRKALQLAQGSIAELQAQLSEASRKLAEERTKRVAAEPRSDENPTAQQTGTAPSMVQRALRVLKAPALTPALGEPGPLIKSPRVNPKDGLTYVWIPPGRFRMGCSAGDSEAYGDEKPAHEVELTKGFWLSETPVTQRAFEKVIGKNPSSFKGADQPVEQVSWEDAAAYCKAVGGRLPTEAEWEYSARGGLPTPRYGDLDAIAWYDKNSNGQTQPVRGKAANAYGLYDMLGNVREWTADWYGPYDAAAVQDPKGPPNGTEKALRGGSWYGSPVVVRASYRLRRAPGVRSSDVGFRCVRE